MCNLSNRNYVRQTPNIVNGRYSLTKSESDLVFALLTEINKDDEDFKDYIFTLKDSFIAGDISRKDVVKWLKQNGKNEDKIVEQFDFLPENSVVTKRVEEDKEAFIDFLKNNYIMPISVYYFQV